jgi:hypothetical protein
VASAGDRQVELQVGEAKILADGGRFSIYRNGHSERVEVASSTLTVVSGGQNWRLEAGQWLEWRDGELLARGDSAQPQEDASLDLLAVAELCKAPLVSAGSLGISNPELAGRVRLDGEDLGPAPVRAYLPIGVHRLHVESAGYADFDGEFKVVAGREYAALASMRSAVDRLDPEWPEDESGAVEASKGQAASSSVPAASSEELLAQARRAMKEKRWADAARVYRRLRRVDPKGDLAHAALVSLGNLELEHLGSPTRARRAYEAYLRRPGALAQEARWGLVRASKGSRGERVVIEDYMRRYANSLEAGYLESRLQALGRAKP